MADDLFKTAPEGVIRYFRAKKSIPTFDWRDKAPEEHAYSWTVAKTMEHDVLEDLRAAVDDAITNRVPFEDFQTNLTPILQQKGWWGRRIQTDPNDGVPKVVQLGSPRRLRTIYWANTMTAHGAGEWERTQRNKRFLPFLVYTLSRAERRRPEHEGWVGMIAPVDDPVWNTLYPPNGWGCMCGVRQISQREAERLGWRADQPPVQLVMRPWRNRRTGQTVMVPQGVDPGWDTNPGKHRARNVATLLAGSIGEMPLRARPAAVADLVASPAFGHFVKNAIDIGLARAAAVPALKLEGLSGQAMADRLNATWPFAMQRFPVAVAPSRFGAEGLAVMIDAATIGHAADHRRTIDVRLWPEIGRILINGLAKRGNDGLVRLYDPASRLFLVLEQVPDAWRILTLFPAKPRYFEKIAGERI